MKVTSTQQRIIQAIADGQLAKNIAIDMRLSQKSILMQVYKAKKVNDCCNRDQLILKAYKAGLIQVNF